MYDETLNLNPEGVMSASLVLSLVCAFLTGATLGAWLAELSHHEPRHLS